MSFDSVYLGGFDATYTVPDNNHSGDVLISNSRKDSFVRLNQFHPLMPLRGSTFPEVLARMDESGASSEVVAHPAGGVTLKIKTTNMDLELDFDLERTPAVVTELRRTLHLPDTDVEETVRLSNFAHCPGGDVAKKLVSWSGSNSVYVWESDDLGDRPPTDDDFVIKVAKGTSIMGVRDLERFFNAASGQYELQLAGMKVADLGLPGQSDELEPRREPLVNNSTTAQLALVVGGVVVLAALLAAMFYWRKRAPAA